MTRMKSTFVPKSIFNYSVLLAALTQALCHTIPIWVNDPFLALGMTVNYTNELGCQGENPATSQCIFSSQLGQGRTTLGMTVACIVKAVLMSTKLNKMVETGIGSPEWAENIIKKVMVVMMMNNVH